MKVGVVLCLFFCLNIWGELNPKATIKIWSGQCAELSSNNLVWEGTGLLVRTQNKTFVVTSQSATYSADPRICHRGKSEGYKGKLQLVSKDWRHGLSLLELEGDLPSEQAVDLTALTIDEPEESAPLLTFGFPTHSDEAISANGILITTKSTRHGIPFLGRAIESFKMRVDVGRVGGPVWTASGSLLGILSDNYLKVVPGAPTPLRVWDRVDGHQEDFLITIPINEVKKWVRDTLSGELKPLFKTSVDDELEGKVRVIAGGLSFSELLPPTDPSSPSAGDFPIGGAEGVGTGGDSSILAAKFRIERVAGKAEVFPFPELVSWQQSELKNLAEYGKAEIPFVFKKDVAVTGDWEHKTFRTLGELVRSLARGGYLIPSIYERSGSPEIDALKAEARKSAQYATYYALHGTFCKDERVLYLLRQIYIVSKVIESDEKDRITKEEIDALLDFNGKYKTAWGFAAVLPDGKELHRRIEAVRKLM